MTLDDEMLAQFLQKERGAEQQSELHITHPHPTTPQQLRDHQHERRHERGEHPLGRSAREEGDLCEKNDAGGRQDYPVGDDPALEVDRRQDHEHHRRESRHDGAVAFMKTYDGANPHYRTVAYEGTLSRDGTEIEGRWIVPGNWSGKFLMVRSAGKAETVSRSVFERA